MLRTVRLGLPEAARHVAILPCVHDGRQRPIDVTCCARCDRFPKCLPPASATLKTTIAGSFRAGAIERETVMDVVATLEATLGHGQLNGQVGAGTDGDAISGAGRGESVIDLFADQEEDGDEIQDVPS